MRLLWWRKDGVESLEDMAMKRIRCSQRAVAIISLFAYEEMMQHCDRITITQQRLEHHGLPFLYSIFSTRTSPSTS